MKKYLIFCFIMLFTCHAFGMKLFCLGCFDKKKSNVASIMYDPGLTKNIHVNPEVKQFYAEMKTELDKNDLSELKLLPNPEAIEVNLVELFNEFENIEQEIAAKQDLEKTSNEFEKIEQEIASKQNLEKASFVYFSKLHNMDEYLKTTKIVLDVFKELADDIKISDKLCAERNSLNAFLCLYILKRCFDSSKDAMDVTSIFFGGDKNALTLTEVLNVLLASTKCNEYTANFNGQTYCFNDARESFFNIALNCMLFVQKTEGYKEDAKIIFNYFIKEAIESLDVDTLNAIAEVFGHMKKYCHSGSNLGLIKAFALAMRNLFIEYCTKPQNIEKIKCAAIFAELIIGDGDLCNCANLIYIDLVSNGVFININDESAKIAKAQFLHIFLKTALENNHRYAIWFLFNEDHNDFSIFFRNMNVYGKKINNLQDLMSIMFGIDYQPEIEYLKDLPSINVVGNFDEIIRRITLALSIINRKIGIDADIDKFELIDAWLQNRRTEGVISINFIKFFKKHNDFALECITRIKKDFFMLKIDINSFKIKYPFGSQDTMNIILFENINAEKFIDNLKECEESEEFEESDDETK